MSDDNKGKLSEEKKSKRKSKLVIKTAEIKERRRGDRQLSCVNVNRATAMRTKVTERLVGGIADDIEDKQAAHELAQHLISISPFNKRWEVIDIINEGTYGVVFEVKDIKTGTPGVIKVAKAMLGSANNQTTDWEGFILEKIFKKSETASVVRLLDKGMLEDQNGAAMEFMVLEKAELNVKDYIYEVNGVERIRRVCSVALQMLKGIYDMHCQGLLHRDLKPDNMGIASRTQPFVLLFDLGMVRMYTEPDGEVRPPRTIVHFRGTPEWASGHAAKGREQSRFDDLIAWLYVVVELFDLEADNEAPLPWSYCKNVKAIRYLKSAHCPARLLLRHCPPQFYAINTYLQSAYRFKPPNYTFIADKVKEARDKCEDYTAVEPSVMQN